MRVHSLLSPKCTTRPSAIDGRGVFALEPFVTGELVAVWGGKIYTTDELSNLAKVLPHFGTHPIAVCPGYYLGSHDLFELDDAELFNHSCDPNIGVRGQIVVVARRPIASGEELTIEYNTFGEVTPFACCCRSVNCRGTIDGEAWRESSFRQAHEGFLSWYLEDRLRCESK